MTAIDVTVVIPTRADGRGLSRAVSSVLRQQVSCTVVVVVDGPIQDPADETVLRELQAPHTVVQLRAHGRPGPARNVGLSLTQTRYVAFLDDDDAFRPEKLARQLPLLDAGRADLVGSDAYRVRGGEVEGTFGHVDTRRVDLAELSRTNPLVTSTVVVRTTVLRAAGGFPLAPECRFCDDYVAWLRLAANGSVMILGEPLVDYHLGSAGSLSAQDPMPGAEVVALALREAFPGGRIPRPSPINRIRRRLPAADLRGSGNA